MPEGPELYKAARFVNEVCCGRIFTGGVIKSVVSHKNPDVPFKRLRYSISARSRGKEMMLVLKDLDFGDSDARPDVAEDRKRSSTDERESAALPSCGILAPMKVELDEACYSPNVSIDSPRTSPYDDVKSSESAAAQLKSESCVDENSFADSTYRRSGRKRKPVQRFDSSPIARISQEKSRCVALAAGTVGSDSISKASETTDAAESEVKPSGSCCICFNFGMSGKFEFKLEADVHKHSHLRFTTADKPPMVLSFVDTRRFGRWRLSSEWSVERGPDPVFEHDLFRKNILEKLEKSVFDRAICEVMHDQEFFNGIGNYLRAEILFRAQVPPFARARDVLAEVQAGKERSDGQKPSEKPDLLDLCRIVPMEVMNLRGLGYGDVGEIEGEPCQFESWLQCYFKDGMKNLIDRAGRRIWFKGPAGALVPPQKSKASA